MIKLIKNIVFDFHVTFLDSQLLKIMIKTKYFA